MSILSLEKIKKTTKNFPNSPGVYFFLNKNNKPIYIGRAGSLKKRIASYFRTPDPRIKEMVQSASGLKFQKTSTLLEAIILEANLIKKYWPKYNVQEKDDRSFDYLVITRPSTSSGQRDKYPRILIIRGRELSAIGGSAFGGEKFKFGRAKIFGPYQSYRLLRTALGLVRKIFPYSTCQKYRAHSSSAKASEGKACFDYQIGLCPGICIGAISEKDYRKNIANIALFFGGEKKKLIKKLKKDYPEKIAALEHINDVALLQETVGAYPRLKKFGEGISGRIEGYDISHLSGKNPVGAMVVFENGERNSNEYRLFKIKNLQEDRNYNDLEMLREVLERRLKHKEWRYPDIIFVDGGLNQVKVIKEILKKNNIFVPVIGLAKVGGHSASASGTDKLIMTNIKKSSKDLLLASKQLFQAIRNEAHRFAISFGRRRSQKFI